MDHLYFSSQELFMPEAKHTSYNSPQQSPPHQSQFIKNDSPQLINMENAEVDSQNSQQKRNPINFFQESQQCVYDWANVDSHENMDSQRALFCKNEDEEENEQNQMLPPFQIIHDPHNKNTGRRKPIPKIKAPKRKIRKNLRPRSILKARNEVQRTNLFKIGNMKKISGLKSLSRLLRMKICYARIEKRKMLQDKKKEIQKITQESVRKAEQANLKNLKRRMYDSLNVLEALGVLSTNEAKVTELSLQMSVKRDLTIMRIIKRTMIRWMMLRNLKKRKELEFLHNLRDTNMHENHPEDQKVYLPAKFCFCQTEGKLKIEHKSDGKMGVAVKKAPRFSLMNVLKVCHILNPTNQFEEIKQRQRRDKNLFIKEQILKEFFDLSFIERIEKQLRLEMSNRKYRVSKLAQNSVIYGAIYERLKITLYNWSYTLKKQHEVMQKKKNIKRQKRKAKREEERQRREELFNYPIHMEQESESESIQQEEDKEIIQLDDYLAPGLQCKPNQDWRLYQGFKKQSINKLVIKTKEDEVMTEKMEESEMEEHEFMAREIEEEDSMENEIIFRNEYNEANIIKTQPKFKKMQDSDYESSLMEEDDSIAEKDVFIVEKMEEEQSKVDDGYFK